MMDLAMRRAGTLAWSAPSPDSPLLSAHLTDERMCTLQFLVRATARLSRELGIHPPAILFEESNAVNAMLVMMGETHPVLVLSSGLLDRLRIDEACAIAHELAHLAHGHPGCPVPAKPSAPLFERLLARWRIGLWALRNRRRELAADRLAAELVGTAALIGALRKSKRVAVSDWLGTHPAPRVRIRHLKRLQPAVRRRKWNPASRTALSA